MWLVLRSVWILSDNSFAVIADVDETFSLSLSPKNHLWWSIDSPFSSFVTSKEDDDEIRLFHCESVDITNNWGMMPQYLPENTQQLVYTTFVYTNCIYYTTFELSCQRIVICLSLIDHQVLQGKMIRRRLKHFLFLWHFTYAKL